MSELSDHNYLDSTVCALVKQASLLEKNYKEMLLQGDEVDIHVMLWRDAIERCRSNSEISHINSAVCQLCTTLQIPETFSFGSLAHLHSFAHIAILQYRLAEGLGHRYNHSYNPADIDERIDLCREALVFINGHSDHISPVFAKASLGTALCIRFTISAEQNDLQEGFALLSSVVHVCPSEPHYLANLGNLLTYLYMVSGSLDHLEESLVILRRAHDLRIGNPARGKICRTIAAAMIFKDNHIGNRVDFCLETLMGLYKEVLLWQPSGHHSHFEGWDGLSMVSSMKFGRTGNMHDLNRAIHYGQTAYTMLNPRHPRAFRYSANLSSTYDDRYEAIGNPADIELALFHAKCAVDFAPPDQRPILLKNLANIMTSAAEYSGDIEVLSEGISLAREALGCVHESEKFLVLDALGAGLIVKASLFGDIEDLEEGIHCIRQLLDCVEQGTVFHFHGVVNASEALLQQYEKNPFQHPHALTEAIQLLEGLGQQQIPEVHRVHVLHWTAKAYRARFLHSGQSDILKLAFAIDQQALRLRPPGHILRCISLAALTEDLIELSMIKEPVDLENLLKMLEEALNTVVEGHPDHFKVIISLARLLLIPNTPYTNCEKSLSSLLHALQTQQGSTYRCVVDLIPVLRSVENKFTPEWVSDDPTRKQCLDIYQALINLLPHLASLDMHLMHRIQFLSQARDLATKASSHAIALAQFGRAIELLECGRAVFWSQHLRLRTSFDSLDSVTASELRDISRLLEITASPDIPPDLDNNLARARIERIMTERRRLNIRFDELVGQVRLLPGMSNFLCNLDYNALSLAATRGPVAIFQTSWLCVIPSPHKSPLIVPLPEVTDGWVQNSARILRELTHQRCARLSINVSYLRDNDNYDTDYDILREMWTRIVHPLLDVLGWTKRTGRQHPRLFLCPTGMLSFLPIHAAGVYGLNQEVCCLSDYCVTSYTPTLSILLSSQYHPATVLRNHTKFLLAAAPKPFMFGVLPAAQDEVDAVSAIVPPQFLISHEDTDKCTLYSADNVLHLLPDATILHLACHGQQNMQEPLKSGFIMHDKMIQVEDIMRLNLPNACLAFLSACETAQGDMERPDEALHLAATMLYAGFKSVIGTMWSMGDVDGPIVAKTVYSELFTGDSDVLDFDVVPYSLDAAVRKLRAQGLEPSRWVPYIHIGI